MAAVAWSRLAQRDAEQRPRALSSRQQVLFGVGCGSRFLGNAFPTVTSRASGMPRSFFLEPAL
jgi:hypothetical protein